MLITHRWKEQEQLQQMQKWCLLEWANYIYSNYSEKQMKFFSPLLWFLDPPVVDPIYQEVRSPNYKSVILRCLVLKSNPSRIASARWYRNTIPIRTPPVDPQDVPQLRFILDPTNNGTYECKVSNGVGTSTCTFLVSGIQHTNPQLLAVKRKVRSMKNKLFPNWTGLSLNT